jgi:hypothetical protein
MKTALLNKANIKKIIHIDIKMKMNNVTYFFVTLASQFFFVEL